MDRTVGLAVPWTNPGSDCPCSACPESAGSGSLILSGWLQNGFSQPESLLATIATEWPTSAVQCRVTRLPSRS